MAVDQGMIDYYGDDLDDVLKSTAVLMSDIFENSKLKESVSVSLVDIIRLPYDPSVGADVPGTDDDGKNGPMMLLSFCEYVKNNSSKKYDAAMYVTR